MQPVLNAGVYVFAQLPIGSSLPNRILGMFCEHESITIILEKTHADELHFQYGAEFAWISLTVHSSLEAVGFTAAFATALTKAGISCNVVAAFYHDHIFVPFARAKEAILVLSALAQ